MNENLQAIITTNQQIQRKAKDLNNRAGENVFPVMSRNDWENWLKGKLNGAISMATIPNVEALQLSELEKDIVDLILSDNPDTITVLEQAFPISYRSGSAPSIKLDSESIAKQLWKNLPDEGVKLPGGRSIEVVIEFNYYKTIRETNIVGLKKQASNYLNGKQFDNWSSESRPTIQLPDLASDNPVVSEVITAQYGTCVIDGTPLVAYGTTVLKGSRYYSSDPWFESKWYQDEAEAKTARAKAVEKLEEIRAEVRKQQELTIAKAEAETVQAKLRSVYDAQYYNTELSSELRDKLSNRRYAYIPSSIDEIKQYTEQTYALVAEVETVLADIACRKAEDEADLARAVAAGEILIGFEAWHRRGGMTSNGDGWVIKADGSLRQHDSDDTRRHKSDGTRHWDRVTRDEMAIRWSCGHMGDVAGNSQFEIVKSPTSGPTQEQLATVRRIEEEIGAPIGAFGLDPEAKKVAEKRLQAIRDAAQKVLGYTPDFDYYKVAGENGVMIEDDGRKFRVNWSAAFNQHCDGRDAQIVRSVRAEDGMLEFLAYDKYGQMNIAMRFRLLTEDEQKQAEQKPISGNGPSLSDLAAAWGAKVKK